MSITCLVCDHPHPGHRYACDDCVIKLQRKIRDIGEYWDLLRHQSFHEPTRGATGRMSPGYGSRSPARDDVLVALDVRSSGDVYGPDDVDEPIIGINAGIGYLVTWVRDLVPDRPCSGLYDLLVLVPYVAAGREVQVFAEQVGRLHQQLRSMTHDQPPGPIATCLTVECGGSCYPEQRRDRPGMPSGAVCRKCGRRYVGRDLIRLSVEREAS